MGATLHEVVTTLNLRFSLPSQFHAAASVYNR